MTTNKPAVQQYSPTTYGVQIAWMQEDDFGGWVRAVNYEVLQTKCNALLEALELISDTDPDEGTAWFHAIADKALAAYRKGEKI